MEVAPYLSTLILVRYFRLVVVLTFSVMLLFTDLSFFFFFAIISASYSSLRDVAYNLLLVFRSWTR